MNAKRAKVIRQLAYQACQEAAVKTGDSRFLTPSNVELANKRIKKFYMRHRDYPASVDMSPARHGMRALKTRAARRLAERTPR